MSGITQNFTLRTSSNVTTVHLVGSWDNYGGQLPMSADVSSKKKGAWKGTFKFTGSTLKPGQRYWYYYILDGYSVTHDPAQNFTKEPTTGRLLNILDVVGSAKSLPPLQIPRGRAVSPSRIACPKPSKPYASRKVREADYSRSPVELDSASDLASRLEAAHLYSPSSSASPTSSVSSGFSSGRSSAAGSPNSPASLASFSDASAASSCRCNRFGITRSGKRVLLDCGGERCGYDSSDACDSDESDSDLDDDSALDSEEDRPVIRTIAPKGAVSSSRANIVMAAPRRTVQTSSRRH